MGGSSAASKAAWQPPGVDWCQRFPELPVPGFQHRNRAVTGPDRRRFLLALGPCDRSSGVALMRCGGHRNFSAPSRRTKLDPCEVPPARFRLPPFARKANGIVAAYKLIRTPVESLRSRKQPPSLEQRGERRNDRLVVGRWLIARYQGDGVGERRGSLQ